MRQNDVYLPKGVNTLKAEKTYLYYYHLYHHFYRRRR